MGEIMLKKAFGQVEKEFNGKKYTLQSMPFKAYYQMIEECNDKNGKLIPSKYYEKIFENVVISPKISWEDFESVDAIEEFMLMADSFLKKRK